MTKPTKDEFHDALNELISATASAMQTQVPHDAIKKAVEAREAMDSMIGRLFPGIALPQMPEVAARFYYTKASERSPFTEERFSIEKKHMPKRDSTRPYHQPDIEFVTVTQCSAYASEVRDAALEEAAQLVEQQYDQHFAKTAAPAIRALQGKPEVAKEATVKTEYRECCRHPDCPTCRGHGGYYRLIESMPIGDAP